MNNQTLFVPVEESEDEKKVLSLYEVKAIRSSDDAWAYNGVYLPPGLEETVTAYFEKSICPGEINFNKPGHTRPEWHLDDSTQSVFLGFFISLFKYAHHRTFKAKWNSITITGSVAVHGDTVEIVWVTHIPEKYAGVKKYAKEHPKKNHLFLYVSDETPLPVASDRKGNPKKLEVRAFTPRDPIGAIIAEVFEPAFDKEQGRLFDISGVQPEWEYVSTPGFERMKRDALSKDWNGFLIHGEGESGKSAMALELAKYLVNAERIYAPVWVRVENKDLLRHLRKHLNNNSSPHDKETRQKKDPLKNPVTAYIAKMIAKTLNLDWPAKDGLHALGKVLNRKANNPYLLIIDNLEVPQVDEVWESIKAIIERCGPKLPVIITSRIKGNVPALKKIDPSVISKNGIEELVRNVAREQGEKHTQELITWKGKQEYDDFVEYLHTHFASFPGMVTVIVPHLDKGLDKILPKLGDLRLLGDGAHSDGAHKRKEAIFKIAFSYLDDFTKAVLFAFIGITKHWMNFGLDELVRKYQQNDKGQEEPLTQKIYTKIRGAQFGRFSYTTAEFEEKTQLALNELLRIHLLHLDSSEAVNQPGETEYYIKTEALTFFLFSESIDNEIIPGIDKTLRDTFIDKKDLIKACIYYNQSATRLETLLKKNDDDQREDYSFLLTAASFSTIPGHIDALIEYGYKNINNTSKKAYRQTPLHFAATFNTNEEVFQRLLYYKPNISKKDADGRTPLHLAAQDNRNPGIITLLLDKGAKIDTPDKNGRTPLHLAAEDNRNPDIITLLLDKGATIDTPDNDGWIPAHYAAWNSNFDVFRCIIEYNKDGSRLLYYPDSEGATPLCNLAMCSTDPNIVPWLKKYINIDDPITSGGIRLLHFAALNDDEIILKKLIKARATIDAKDNGGLIALHYAAMNPKLG